jgi:predicted nucleotidyltransferase component of viral defense system
MSIPLSSPPAVDLDAWVDEARPDPSRYRQRQVSRILLHAVARTPVLRDALYLKGGTLMSAVHSSARQTGDIDFTAVADDHVAFTEALRGVLDRALVGAAADLGYLDIMTRVQKLTRQPLQFETATAPALQMTIGTARRGGNEEARLRAGQAPTILRVDISFKEPVFNIEVLGVDTPDQTILVYSDEEVIAEKLRALIQQPLRNRNRRQDTYDIAWLIGRRGFDADARQRILTAFLGKADARAVQPTADALDDPEVRRRAGAEWSTMELEIGTVPDFTATYDQVVAFYRALPW